MELEKGVARLTAVGRDVTAVVLPVSDATRGHGSHTIASLWIDELEGLLRRAQAKVQANALPEIEPRPRL
jgi:hypothetical protein